MFREIILPIFRSTRLCVTVCGIMPPTMLPAGGRQHIYLLIKYIKSVLWKVAKRLSYIEDARCLKVKMNFKARGHGYMGGINGCRIKFTDF